MKKILILGLILLSQACSFDRKLSQPHKGKGAVGDNEAPATSNTPAMEGNVDGQILGIIETPGSAMRFLDARALTRYYQNVFKRKAYGFEHCKNSVPPDIKDCDDFIFTPAERPSMGTFDFGSPRMGRSPSNVNPATGLTLNYMRTLRTALARECTSLVDTELANLKAKSVTENVLVKGEKPTAADLDGFMKKILGLEAAGASVVLDFDAAGYVANFETVTAADTDKVRGQREAFLGICIAISMDPMVFLY